MIGVVGEYIASTVGIGFQIEADAQVFATACDLAGVAVIVVLAVVITELLKLLERKLAPWRRVDDEQG